MLTAFQPLHPICIDNSRRANYVRRAKILLLLSPVSTAAKSRQISEEHTGKLLTGPEGALLTALFVLHREAEFMNLI